MTYQKLDLLFPYIIFFYGALVTFVVNHPRLVELAEERMPPQALRQLMAHRALALICLLVGALWVLQNLWFDSMTWGI
jgi:protein-S-isoprenylcysteine O-methyltransferase Ste14